MKEKRSESKHLGAIESGVNVIWNDSTWVSLSEESVSFSGATKLHLIRKSYGNIKTHITKWNKHKVTYGYMHKYTCNQHKVTHKHMHIPMYTHKNRKRRSKPICINKQLYAYTYTYSYGKKYKLRSQQKKILKKYWLLCQTQKMKIRPWKKKDFASFNLSFGILRQIILKESVGRICCSATIMPI